jgi:hypothetical protein
MLSVILSNVMCLKFLMGAEVCCYAECQFLLFAECHSAKCHVFKMFNVVLRFAVMLSVLFLLLC